MSIASRATPNDRINMRILLALIATCLGIGLATACAAPQEVSTEPGAPAAADAGGDSPEAPAPESQVTKVGTWATADDGIAFRVSKLKKSTVGALASGGRPGDPAVVATIQFRNGSKRQFDATMVTVTARLGADGVEAEQVFQEGTDGMFDGTISPGRTATTTFMFAAEKTADLKAVSIEVNPGFEYESFQFEGGL
ncbi:hypothetical protein [Actinomadura sediminis]|uniref:DUF4352 domain-containing protein n=1 Tax=Actinomadura sediminis TaxID=1038904 RepID=A0ABW3EU97_9ACTN